MRGRIGIKPALSLGGALLLLVPTFAGPARADGVPDLAPAIQFDGFPGCIDEADLERRVAPLVRPERLSAERRVTGSVELEGPGPVVQFRVLDGGELIGRRRLEFTSADCATFRETVEVVVAMLLEGHGFDEPAEAEAPPEPVPAPPPPAPPPPSPAPKPAKTHRVRGHFRLGPELSVGVLPAPAAGLRLEGGVELGIPLALMARASWHLTSTTAIEGGGVLEVGGYRLAATACYLVRPRWVLSLCGGMGFVSLTASGRGVPGARADQWGDAAVVLGAGFSYPVWRSLTVELGAEMEAWFSRPEYVLVLETGPRVLGTASGVPALLWLAVGYSF
jgi:hypothetical protein